MNSHAVTFFLLPSKLNKSENKQNQSTFSSYKHGTDEKRCLYQLSIENMILELKITFLCWYIFNHSSSKRKH